MSLKFVPVSIHQTDVPTHDRSSSDWFRCWEGDCRGLANFVPALFWGHHKKHVYCRTALLITLYKCLLVLVPVRQVGVCYPLVPMCCLSKPWNCFVFHNIVSQLHFEGTMPVRCSGHYFHGQCHLAVSCHFPPFWFSLLFRVQSYSDVCAVPKTVRKVMIAQSKQCQAVREIDSDRQQL